MALSPLNAGIDPRFQQPNPPAPPDLPGGGASAGEPTLSAAPPEAAGPVPGQAVGPGVAPAVPGDPLAGMRAELARRVAETPLPETRRRFLEIGREALRLIDQGALQPPGGEMVPPEEEHVVSMGHFRGGMAMMPARIRQAGPRKRVISVRPYHLAPSRELPETEREEATRLGLVGTALPGPSAPGRTVWVPVFEGEENDPELARRLRLRALVMSRQQHPFRGAEATAMAAARGWALNVPALSETWRREEEEAALLAGMPTYQRWMSELGGMSVSKPAELLGQGLLRVGNLFAAPLERAAARLGGKFVGEAFEPVIRRLADISERFGSRELNLSTWELSRAAELLDRAGARVIGEKGGMKVILPPDADQVLVDRAVELLRSVAKRQGGKLGLRIVRQTAGRRVGELALKAGASAVRHGIVGGGFTGAYAAPELAGMAWSGEITPGQALGTEASAIAHGAALFGPLGAAGRLVGEAYLGRLARPRPPVPELPAWASERPLLEAGEAAGAATPGAEAGGVVTPPPRPPMPPVEPVLRATPGVLQTPIPEVRPLSRAEGPPSPVPEPEGTRDPRMASSPVWAGARLDTARRHAREAVDATGDPRPIEVAEKVAEDLEFLRPALGTMSDTEVAAANTGAVAVIEEAGRLAGSAGGVRRADRLLGIDTDGFFREPGLRGPGVVEVAGKAATIRWADELVQAANRHDVQLPDPPAAQDGSLPGVLAPALELAGRLDEAGVPVPPLVARDPRTGRVRVYRWEDIQALGPDLPRFLRGEDRPNEFVALRERVKSKTRAWLEDLGPREVVATFTSGAGAKPLRTVLTREEARAIEAEGEGPAPEPVQEDVNIPLGKELTVPTDRDWQTRPWEAAKQQKVAASRAFAGFDEERPIAVGVARTPSGEQLAVVQWAGEPWFQDQSGRIAPVRYYDLGRPGWGFAPVPGLPVRWELTDRGELRLAEVDPKAAAEFEQARRELMGVEQDILGRTAEAIERLESPRTFTVAEVQALRDALSELDEEIPEAPPEPDIVPRDGSDAATVLRQADGYEKAGGWLAARQFSRQAKKVLNARAKAEDATEPTVAVPTGQAPKPPTKQKPAQVSQADREKFWTRVLDAWDEGWRSTVRARLGLDETGYAQAGPVADPLVGDPAARQGISLDRERARATLNVVFRSLEEADSTSQALRDLSRELRVLETTEGGPWEDRAVLRLVTLVSALGFLAQTPQARDVRAAARAALARMGEAGKVARRLIEASPALRWLVDDDAPPPPRLVTPWNVRRGEAPTAASVADSQAEFLARYVEPAVRAAFEAAEDQGALAALATALYAASREAGGTIALNFVYDQDSPARALAFTLFGDAGEIDAGVGNQGGPSYTVGKLGFEPSLRGLPGGFAGKEEFVWAVPLGVFAPALHAGAASPAAAAELPLAERVVRTLAAEGAVSGEGGADYEGLRYFVEKEALSRRAFPYDVETLAESAPTFAEEESPAATIPTGWRQEAMEVEENDWSKPVWKWVEGSVFVHPDGSPIIFYHGTADPDFLYYERQELGKVTGAYSARKAIWAASDPVTSREFCKLAIKQMGLDVHELIPGYPDTDEAIRSLDALLSFEERVEERRQLLGDDEEARRRRRELWGRVIETFWENWPRYIEAELSGDVREKRPPGSEHLRLFSDETRQQALDAFFSEASYRQTFETTPEKPLKRAETLGYWVRTIRSNLDSVYTSGRLDYHHVATITSAISGLGFLAQIPGARDVRKAVEWALSTAGHQARPARKLIESSPTLRWLLDKDAPRPPRIPLPWNLEEGEVPTPDDVMVAQQRFLATFVEPAVRNVFRKAISAEDLEALLAVLHGAMRWAGRHIVRDWFRNPSPLKRGPAIMLLSPDFVNYFDTDVPGPLLAIVRMGFRRHPDPEVRKAWEDVRDGWDFFWAVPTGLLPAHIYIGTLGAPSSREVPGALARKLHNVSYGFSPMTRIEREALKTFVENEILSASEQPYDADRLAEWWTEDLVDAKSFDEYEEERLDRWFDSVWRWWRGYGFGGLQFLRDLYSSGAYGALLRAYSFVPGTFVADMFRQLGHFIVAALVEGAGVRGGWGIPAEVASLPEFEALKDAAEWASRTGNEVVEPNLVGMVADLGRALVQKLGWSGEQMVRFYYDLLDRAVRNMMSADSLKKLGSGTLDALFHRERHKKIYEAFLSPFKLLADTAETIRAEHPSLFDRELAIPYSASDAPYMLKAEADFWGGLLEDNWPPPEGFVPALRDLFSSLPEKWFHGPAPYPGGSRQNPVGYFPSRLHAEGLVRLRLIRMNAVRLFNPLIVPAEGEPWHVVGMGKNVNKAIEGGHDSALFTDLVDLGPPNDIIAVLDPDDIRIIDPDEDELYPPPPADWRQEPMEAEEPEEVRGEVNIANILHDQTAGRYKSHPVGVAIREAVQNALGAVRRQHGGSGGRIRIAVDPADLALTIEDDGDGMSPETIRENFLSLANVKVQEKEGTVGGFGIGAKAIFVFSEVRVWTNDGSTITELEVDPHEYRQTMKARMTTRPARPDDPRGTRLTMRFPSMLHDMEVDAAAGTLRWKHPPEARLPGYLDGAPPDDAELAGRDLKQFAKSAPSEVAAAFLRPVVEWILAFRVYSELGLLDPTVRFDFEIPKAWKRILTFGPPAQFKAPDVNAVLPDGSRLRELAEAWNPGEKPHIHLRKMANSLGTLQGAEVFFAGPLHQLVQGGDPGASRAMSFVPLPVLKGALKSLGLPVPRGLEAPLNMKAVLGEDVFDFWRGAGVDPSDVGAVPLEDIEQELAPLFPKSRVKVWGIGQKSTGNVLPSRSPSLVLHVSIRGLPQFSTRIAVPQTDIDAEVVNRLGSAIFLDLDPQVGERDALYPFLPSREDLKGNIEQAVRAFFATKINDYVQEAAERLATRYVEDSYGKLPPTSVQAGNKPQKFNIFRTTDVFDKHEAGKEVVEKVRKGKFFNALLEGMARFRVRVESILTARSLPEKAGLGLGEVPIPGLLQQNLGLFQIDLNPFLGWELTDKASILGYSRTVPLRGLTEEERTRLLQKILGEGFPVQRMSRSGVLRGYVLNPVSILHYSGFGRHDPEKLQRWAAGELSPEDDEIVTSVLRMHVEYVVNEFLEVAIHEIAHAGGTFPHKSPTWQHAVQRITRAAGPMLDRFTKDLVDVLMGDRQALVDAVQVTRTARAIYDTTENTFGSLPIEGVSSEREEQAGEAGAARPAGGPAERAGAAGNRGNRAGAPARRRGIPVSPGDALTGTGGWAGRREALPDGAGSSALRATREGADVGGAGRPSLAARPAGRIWRKLRWFRLPVWRDDLPELLADRKPSVPGPRYVGEDPFAWPGRPGYVYSLGLSLRLSHPPGAGSLLVAWEDEADALDALAVNGHGYVHEVRVFPANPLVLEISAEDDRIVHVPSVLRGYTKARYGNDLRRFVRELREGLHPTKPPSKAVTEFFRWLWDDSGSTFDAVHIVLPGRPAATVVKDSSTILPLAVGGKKLTAEAVRELADLRNLRMSEHWVALQTGAEWARRWDVPVQTRLYLRLDADHWRRPDVPVLTLGREKNVEQKEVFLAEGDWVDIRGDRSIYLDAAATEARLAQLMDLGAIPRRVWARLDTEKVHERNLTVRQVLREVPRLAESLGLDPSDALPAGVVLRASLHGEAPAVVVFDRSRLRPVEDFSPGAWRQQAMAAPGGPAPWKMPWPLWKALHPEASKRDHLLAIADALEKGLPVPTSVLQSYDGMYEMVMEKDPRILALDLARRGEGLPEWAFEILSDEERVAWLVRRIGQLSMPGGKYRQVRKAHLLRALRRLGLPMADGTRIFPFGWEPPLDLLPRVDEALLAALKRHKLLVSATQKLKAELDAMRGVERKRGEGRKLSLEEAAEVVAQWVRDPEKLTELDPDLLYAVARHFQFLDAVEDPYSVLPPVTMAYQDDQGRPNEKARQLMDLILSHAGRLSQEALAAGVALDEQTKKEHKEAINPLLKVLEHGNRWSPVHWAKATILYLQTETRSLLAMLENISVHTKRMEAVVGPELQAPTPRMLYERIVDGELERNPWAVWRAALMGRLIWLKQILAEVDDIFEAVERIPKLDVLLWRMLNGDLTPEQAVAMGIDRHTYTVRTGKLSPVKKTVEVSLVDLYRRFRKVTDRIKEQWLEARANIYEETRVAPTLMTTWSLEYELDMLRREISMFEQALAAEAEGSPAGLLAACGVDLDSVELGDAEDLKEIIAKARKKAYRVIKARKKRMETVERDLKAMRELLGEKRATRTQIAEPGEADIREYAPHQEAMTEERAKRLAKDTASTIFSDLREPADVGFVHGERREEKVKKVLPSFLLTFSDYLRRAANYIWLAPVQVRSKRVAKQLPSPMRELYNMWIQRTLGIPDMVERHLNNGFKDWHGQKKTNLDRFIKGMTGIDPSEDLRTGPSNPARHALYLAAVRAVGTLVNPIAGTALNMTQILFSGARMSTSLKNMLAAPFLLAGAAAVEAGIFADVGLRKFFSLFVGKGILKRDIRREALISSYEQFMEFYGERKRVKWLSPVMPIKLAYGALAKIALFGLYITDLYFKSVTFRAFRWWAAMDGVPDEVIDIGGLKMNARDYVALYHTERVYPNYSPAGRPPVMSTLPGRAWAVLRTFPLALRDWLVTDRMGARFSKVGVKRALYGSRVSAWERFLAKWGRRLFLTRPFRAVRPEWAHETFVGPGPKEPETRLPWEKGARLARVRSLIEAFDLANATGDVDVPPMEPPGVAFRRWLGQNATEEEREAARAMLQTIPPHGELGMPTPEAISAFRFRWLAKYPWMIAAIMFLAKFAGLPNWLQLVVPTAIGGQTAILAALDYFYRWVSLRAGRALMGGYPEPWMERAEKEAWANMISQVYGGRVLASQLLEPEDPQAILDRARQQFRQTMNHYKPSGPAGD